MKKRMLAGIVALLLCIPLVLAQEIPQDVVSAFSTGDAAKLARYFGDKVTLVFQGNSRPADKQKATAALQEFFAKKKVKGFSVNHQGRRDGSSFLIGTLSTQQEKFRVNCFLRRVKDKSLIHQIRIDKINE